MAISDTKKDVFLGQSVEQQVKNIDDNFTSLFDTADDLNDAINNSGFITKDVNNLTNYTLKTKTGTAVELSIDNTSYVMTLNLKNESGTVVSTATIDFPIESMVINATYANGILTLTLQNGTTVDVDISDIVSGLVPDTRKVNGKALSADITLTQDDVGDGTTYKRFSATYKTNVDENTKARHTHANKALLDTYDQTNANIKDAVDKRHSHSNKTVLDNTTASYTTAEKEKLAAIDDSLKNVTADQIGKVKDVKVNGTSVLGTDGVAAITIAAIKADFVSVATTDNLWTTRTVGTTVYQAIKVEKTHTALGVFNESGEEIVIQKVYDDSYLYLCVGTAKIACTIRKLGGNSLSSGGKKIINVSGNSGGGLSADNPDFTNDELTLLLEEEDFTVVYTKDEGGDYVKYYLRPLKRVDETITCQVYLIQTGGNKTITCVIDKSVLQYTITES